MDWLRNNLVGLLAIIVTTTGSIIAVYTTLSTKVATNAEAIRAVEVKLDDFTETNNRLVTSLDKLELLYNESKVKDAVQDEKLRQVNEDLEKLENSK